MFNLFRKKKTGPAIINDAIGQFEAIAANIEVGVQQSIEQAAANDAVILAKMAHNKELNDAMDRGRSVAGKLRALIS